MTTVAWKDGMLAADTLCDSNGMKSNGTKIFALDDGRNVGIAGSYTLGMQFIEALKRGETLALETDERRNFHAIVMLLDGSLIEYEDGKTPIRVEDKFYAIGSGKLAAMAAMACGKSAKDAVKIAARFDVYTGGSVNYVYAKTKRRK